MSAQVSPSPGNDRDDERAPPLSPPPQGNIALLLSVLHDATSKEITITTRRLAWNKAHGWDELSSTSEERIPWKKRLNRPPNASVTVTRVMAPVLASCAALVQLEIVLPRSLLGHIQRALGDLSVPVLEKLTVSAGPKSRGHSASYPRLISDLFSNGAPRLTEVVLANVGWPEAGLPACGAITSVTLLSDFPLTDDLGFLLRDCGSRLRALHIAAPSSAAVPCGLGVMRNLKRLTAALDLDPLLSLNYVLPPGLEYLGLAERGAAGPSGSLVLLYLLFWIADRQVSLYLARNLFAVRCHGAVRVLQKADGSIFLTVDWLRKAVVPQLVTSLDISLIDWSIIANALEDAELCALSQLTVRYARDPPFIPDALPVHSQLTLRCPNLQTLVLQDFSHSWTLPLENVAAFLRDCLQCDPRGVRICPRGATIVSHTESRDFNSLTTPQMLAEVVANGGTPIDEFAFWEDPARVLASFAPQAYRYYRMGAHALTTDRGDD